MEENISHWDIFLQTRRTEKAEEENIWKKRKKLFSVGKKRKSKWEENIFRMKIYFWRRRKRT